MNEFVRVVLSNDLTSIVCIITLSVFVLFVAGLFRIMWLSGKFRKIKSIEAIKTEKHAARIFKKYEARLLQAVMTATTAARMRIFFI